MLEEPSDRTADCLAASEIAVAKQSAHVAVPIDGGGDAPSLFAPHRLTRPIARPVGGHIQAWRPRCAYRLHHHCRGIRPIENEKKNRSYLHLRDCPCSRYGRSMSLGTGQPGANLATSIM